MKLTTKIDISFEEWLNQVKRFADYEYDIKTATLPKDISTSKKAEIDLKITSLSYPKFKATVEYVQNWETFITVPTFDDQGVENGTEEIAQPQRKVVLSYNMEKSYEEIQAILTAVEPLVDQNLTGKAKLEAQMMKAMILDVIGHYTFTTEEYPSGLPEEQYDKTY